VALVGGDGDHEREQSGNAAARAPAARPRQQRRAPNRSPATKAKGATIPAVAGDLSATTSEGNGCAGFLA
jgi:hypothetical protein